MWAHDDCEPQESTCRGEQHRGVASAVVARDVFLYEDLLPGQLMGDLAER